MPCLLRVQQAQLICLSNLHGCLKFSHAEIIHQLIWLFCYRVKEKSLFLLTTLIDNFFRLSHLIINDHILKILKHDIK